MSYIAASAMGSSQWQATRLPSEEGQRIPLHQKRRISLVFEPHMLIYSILSHKYGMHPKYAFFKRIYGYEFPFEEELKNEIV
ncbi:MAG: hypothetical protein Q8O57_09680 [Kiritimatiellota bacterium]|nr:hypothetical protein [Kiritimatiellota bacterium]